MINQVSFVQLQYVLALAEHKHFKKAAEACNVTQPTLSMQLQKLEDQLGLILFDRKSLPIVPTTAGRQVVQQADKILQEVNKLRQVVENQKDEISGEYRIGILPTIAPYLLPRIVPAITEQMPLVFLSAFEKTTDQVVKDLHVGHLDIGIMVTPYEDKQLHFVPLYKEEFVLYVSHRHKLFDKQVIRADELNPDDIWVLEEGHCFREQVINICGKKEGQSGRFSYKSGSLEALKRLVDKYGGITLLPEFAIEDLDSNSMKHVRKLAAPYPVREVNLVVHKNFAKMALVKKLKNIIQTALPFNLQEKNNIKVISY
jgi:LysR family hydrogen peroxide-inducible transcriptional activator